MKTIRVGVIGVGYLGKFHANIYAQMPAVELVGVVDADQQRADSIAAQTNSKSYRHLEDLLERVDAVSVVVPTSAHEHVAVQLLEQGIHMLLEKPIAMTYDSGLKIVELAKKRDLILQIGHLERFNAGVMALAHCLTRPRFIEAHRMGAFVARASDIDVVSDLMIHDIDIILSLVKSKITDIAAVGTPVLTDHVDIANARLTFASGVVANVTASRVSDKPLRRIRVFEENSYKALNFIDQQLEMVNRVPQDAGLPRIVREAINVDPVQPLNAELDAFVHCVREHQVPLVDGEVGLEALRVALKIKQIIG